jgi:hypothetical protein
MKNFFVSLICLPAFFSLAHASPITVFDSLPGDNFYTGYTIANSPYYTSVAASFSILSTDSLMLDDVEVTLLASNPKDGGMLNVGLYSDSSTSPNTLLDSLGTINDSSLTTSPAEYAIPVTPFSLASGRYWIVISSSDGSSAAWGMTDIMTGAGVSSGYFGDPYDGYVLNSNTGYGAPFNQVAFEMQVDGLTPEPSTILFGAIGLAMLAAYRRRVAS